MSLYSKMCNMTCKKACLILILLFFFMLFTIYSLFFHHGPPEYIMEVNRQGDKLNVKVTPVTKDTEESPDELEQELEAELTKAAEKWRNFIKVNNYVSIGDIYDNCDKNDQLMIGKTIMLPDPSPGWHKPVKTRTFMNITVDSEVYGGRLFLSVNYKGYNVYNYSWELCTLDEDRGDDRIINCPFVPGVYNFVKDVQIPIHWPKGRYETKGWITNQDDETIVCGFVAFTL